MTALRIRAFGGVEVLSEDRVDLPEVRADEVLLAVRACGVNRIDVLTRQGQTRSPVPLPHTPGTEVTGDVVACGENVTGISIGDRAVVNPIISCGGCAACREGKDNLCPHAGVLGVEATGGYCEYLSVPARLVVRLPDEVSYEQAAAVTVGGATARHMLVERANVRDQESILIVAAASGVGVMAVQIAKALGARVIATAGSDDKLELVEGLGADHVVNHRQPHWGRKVRGLTGGVGVDVVFEHVGQATWTDSLAALGSSGRLVTCGGHSGFDVRLNLAVLLNKYQTIMGSFGSTRHDLEAVIELVATGELRAVIDRCYPLTQAADAHTRIEDRTVLGKILLLPRGTSDPHNGTTDGVTP